MLNAKQTELHLKDGWTEPTLMEIDEFLATNGSFSFHNLANIGGGDYRLMYRETTGTDAKGKPIQTMHCKLGRIHYLK